MSIVPAAIAFCSSRIDFSKTSNAGPLDVVACERRTGAESAIADEDVVSDQPANSGQGGSGAEGTVSNGTRII